MRFRAEELAVRPGLEQQLGEVQQLQVVRESQLQVELQLRLALHGHPAPGVEYGALLLDLDHALDKEIGVNLACAEGNLGV
jgi:hypothetical protein